METHSRLLMASLRPGESLHWIGSPHGRVVRLQELLALAPLALLIPLAVAYARQGGVLGSLKALVIVAVGIGTSGIVLMRRLRQEYAVTSERVLIASRFPLPRIQSIELASLDHVELQPEADGTASLALIESRLGLVTGISAEVTPADHPSPRLERLFDALTAREAIERAKRLLDAPRTPRAFTG